MTKTNFHIPDAAEKVAEGKASLNAEHCLWVNMEHNEQSQVRCLQSLVQLHPVLPVTMLGLNSHKSQILLENNTT